MSSAHSWQSAAPRCLRSSAAACSSPAAIWCPRTPAVADHTCSGICTAVSWRSGGSHEPSRTRCPGPDLVGHPSPLPQPLDQPLHPGPLAAAGGISSRPSLGQEEPGGATLRSALAPAALFRFAGEYPRPLRRHGGVFPRSGQRADWGLRAPAPRHRYRPLRHPRQRGGDPQGKPQPQSIWESQSLCGGQAPAAPAGRASRLRFGPGPRETRGPILRCLHPRPLGQLRGAWCLRIVTAFS